MWSVVNFQSDNTVAAVPEFWYRNGMCAWPNKFNNKLIERRTKPNSLEFSNFKAKILFKNIDNYLKARALAQENSDVSSCNDMLHNDLPKKTKRKSIPMCDNIKTIPNPPIYADSEESNMDDSDVDKTYSPMNQLNQNNVPQSSSDDDNCLSNGDTMSFDKIPQTSGSACKKLKFDHHVKNTSISKNLLNQVSDSPSWSPTLLNPLDKFPLSSQTLLNPANEYPVSSVSTINSELENKLDVLISSFKGVERNITVIKHEIKNFHDRLDSVNKMQETILDKMMSIISNDKSNQIYEDLENDGIIYIDSDTNFNIMEDKLLNDKLFRNKVNLIVLIKTQRIQPIQLQYVTKLSQ